VALIPYIWCFWHLNASTALFVSYLSSILSPYAFFSQHSSIPFMDCSNFSLLDNILCLSGIVLIGEIGGTAEEDAAAFIQVRVC